MTCIVGLVADGTVYIGADSAGVSGWDLTIRRDRKVFRNGEFVIGFTTSFRMGQLLRYAFTPPKRHADDDVEKYMVTTFIDAVRDCLKAGGFANKQNEVEGGGMFLVGYEGRLFRVENDYQIGESCDGFDAVGCGSAYALGALLSAEKVKPEARIDIALKAAAHFSAGVSAPFHTENLG